MCLFISWVSSQPNAIPRITAWTEMLYDCKEVENITVRTCVCAVYEHILKPKTTNLYLD
jgi:hypothetical protein